MAEGRKPADGSAMSLLTARIDELLKRRGGDRPVLAAIDGPCAGGKTTLAARLGALYDAPVLHMDDYFLQPHQRTPQRYAAPGENVDHERFLEEVLLPLDEGREAMYRPFDCGRMALGEARVIARAPLMIVEGSYSLHPQLEAYYDLRVLLTADERLRHARILKRNGSEGLRVFIERWIPLENRYFERTRIEARCDVRLHADADGVLRLLL